MIFLLFFSVYEKIIKKNNTSSRNSEEKNRFVYTTKNAFFVSGNRQTIDTNEHADTCVRPGSSGFLELRPDAARPEIPPSLVFHTRRAYRRLCSALRVKDSRQTRFYCVAGSSTLVAPAAKQTEHSSVAKENRNSMILA